MVDLDAALGEEFLYHAGGTESQGTLDREG